ncbi:OLC1v1036948C1 [Oldenlandia corymbosa var. corymbosa]|uniref:OLC1v1036948C1 n=1 Tax=Oldenlandia corymbosa var. corymbosa TaxID=529605 RepID=A0AAV1CWL1_OLDCO|nr:OLC1v1036948C1 [Oldenlandia corymbosa var. corymbosa]
MAADPEVATTNSSLLLVRSSSSSLVKGSSQGIDHISVNMPPPSSKGIDHVSVDMPLPSSESVSKYFDDDGRLKRTGTFWTNSANTRSNWFGSFVIGLGHRAAGLDR